jgi:DNA polymerase-3 subunit alpha (Gram-positive type)
MEHALQNLLATFRTKYWWEIPGDFVIFDLETTGLNAKKDRILEIGAIHVNKTDFLATGKIDTFECFIKQHAPIPLESQEIHHITDEMVATGLSEYEALSKFFRFCDRKWMLSYNSPFDVGFLLSTGKRCNYPVELEDLESVEDIYKLARKYINKGLVPNKKLHTIAEVIGVNNSNPHRALGDALTSFYVYIFLKQLEFQDMHFDYIKTAKQMAIVTGQNESETLEKLIAHHYSKINDL